MEKRRKIFDDDATMVEAIEVEKKEEAVPPIVRRAAKMAVKPEPITVKVIDVLDAFAGYLPSQAAFNESEGKGTCILCGKETTTSLRKICFDCLKQRAMELHHEAVSALSDRKTEFELNI